MPPPTPITAPVEAGPDTDRAVAMAYLRDTKGKPFRPYTKDAHGRWWWRPNGEKNPPASVPEFSTDWGAAGQLAGRLASLGYVVGIFVTEDGAQVRLDRGFGPSPTHGADRFPLALCRAALAIVEAEKTPRKGNRS